MKDFFKYVLATVTGLIIMGLIITIITIISLVGMMSSATISVPDDCVMVLKLDGELNERASSASLTSMITGGSSQLGLSEILTAIQNAKENEDIKGIYIEGGNLSGATPAMLQEIRQALLDFKKTKKFIVAYADTYTQGSYYISSVADSVFLNPQGMVDWKGLAMQTVYYKEVMDKLGVRMEIFKVGTYKSAVEPFMLTETSEANREQITTFSKEIWGEMKKEVAASRKLTSAQLDALADTMMMFVEPTFYKKTKLVDKLVYSDYIPKMLARMTGKENAKEYNTISAQDLAASTAMEPKGTSGNVIAVYYAFGDIVQEPSEGLTADDEIAATKVIKDLHELTENEDIKAVVLRVNSGGGSAYASEQIWHAITEMKAKKPVIVSMGGMAASGGYYISCNANWIVAEPTTLTGSIGIFGMMPVAKELINDKIGLHYETVKTNRFGDYGDYTREMNDGGKESMQQYVNRGYELFTKRCADGRGMKQDEIKAIAEGRVWTGLHAKQLGLVDQLGNLDDAIAVAKKRAKVDECTILSYPAPKSMFDNLFSQSSGESYANEYMKNTLGDFYGVIKSIKQIKSGFSMQAQLPYYFIYNL